MIKFIFAIVASLAAVSSFSQSKALDPYFLKQDFVVFENVLKLHPQLHEHISEEEFAKIFEENKSSINSSQTALEFFKTLTNISSSIKDGNTKIYASRNIHTDNSYFPLLFKPITGNLYTDIEDQNVFAGSKLVSIDGIPADSILKRIYKYATSDGENMTRKLKQIEAYFSLYYFYEFGNSKQYSTTFESPEGTLFTVNLEGTSYESLLALNQIRHSYSYKKNTVNESKLPYLTYTDNEKVIQLTVNTFGINPQIFKKELAGVFKLINSAEIDYLIVDIRNNEGGFRENAIELFTYLSTEEFSQIKNRSIKSTNYPYQQYLINTFSEENIKDIYGDKLVSTIDSKKAQMTPKQEAFKGKIFLLTSGLNASNASLFAMNAKNTSNITLVGEETGTNYYFHMGGQTIYYELPHSKIKLVVPTERLVHDVEFGNNPEGEGVVPHYTVDMTVYDLIEGFDTQLNYIFDNLILKSGQHKLVSKPSLPHAEVQASR